MSKSSFGFAKPEDSPGFLLWQTTITWQRKIKAVLEPYNIAHAQFVILALLLWLDENKQAPIQSAIVEKSKLDKMTVSKALKKLSAEKLVERQENKQDTRAKSVCLTKQGRALTKKLVKLVETVDAEFFNVIAKKDQRQLLDILCSL